MEEKHEKGKKRKKNPKVPTPPFDSITVPVDSALSTFPRYKERPYNCTLALNLRLRCIQKVDTAPQNTHTEKMSI